MCMREGATEAEEESERVPCPFRRLLGESIDSVFECKGYHDDVAAKRGDCCSGRTIRPAVFILHVWETRPGGGPPRGPAGAHDGIVQRLPAGAGPHQILQEESAGQTDEEGRSRGENGYRVNAAAVINPSLISLSCQCF